MAKSRYLTALTLALVVVLTAAPASAWLEARPAPAPVPASVRLPAPAPALGQSGLSATGPISPTDSPPDSGRVEYPPPDVPDLTDAQRQAIQSEIDQNIQRLGLQKLSAAAFTTSLTWPVRGAAGLADYGYYGISAFVDHNPAAGQLQDWNCGTRTYDVASGYNHRGTDIFSWPFGWNKMDNSEVEIVAAAPGTIVLKYDGNSDRSCTMNNNQWNGVNILHDDGSVAWYGHMKKNSVTSKAVGALVARGEYLGVVGSSGSSTGPHLHFELHASNANGSAWIDPYAGTCSPTTPSWWADQRPYYDSAINKLSTGTGLPVSQTCPNPTLTNIKDLFNPGDTIYFITYYRDQLSGQTSQYKIYKPDGSLYKSWSTTASSYAALSYWYNHYTLSASAPVGLWKYEVVYLGQTYQHTFSVGNALTLRGSPGNHTLRLSWEAVGTLPAATAWQITYAGPLGDQPYQTTGIISATRAFTLTGLTNYTWYTVTLAELDSVTPVLTSTLKLMPTDIFNFLPLVTR